MQAPETIRSTTGYPMMIPSGAEANESNVLDVLAAQRAMSKQANEEQTRQLRGTIRHVVGVNGFFGIMKALVNNEVYSKTS